MGIQFDTYRDFLLLSDKLFGKYFISVSDISNELFERLPFSVPDVPVESYTTALTDVESKDLDKSQAFEQLQAALGEIQGSMTRMQETSKELTQSVDNSHLELQGLENELKYSEAEENRAQVESEALQRRFIIQADSLKRSEGSIHLLHTSVSEIWTFISEGGSLEDFQGHEVRTRHSSFINDLSTDNALKFFVEDNDFTLEAEVPDEKFFECYQCFKDSGDMSTSWEECEKNNSRFKSKRSSSKKPNRGAVKAKHVKEVQSALSHQR